MTGKKKLERKLGLKTSLVTIISFGTLLTNENILGT